MDMVSLASYDSCGLGTCGLSPRPTGNINHFCILWDIDKPTLDSIVIDSGDPHVGKRPFKLKWEKFAGSCFVCGGFGHMQSKCPDLKLQPPPVAIVKETHVKAPTSSPGQSTRSKQPSSSSVAPSVADKSKDKQFLVTTSPNPTSPLTLERSSQLSGRVKMAGRYPKNLSNRSVRL